MEIYRQTPDPKVFIYAPRQLVEAATEVEAAALDSLLPLVVFTPDQIAVINTPERTGFEVTLPWELMTSDRDFYVDVRASYPGYLAGEVRVFEEREFVQVVTPILTAEEITRITGETDPVEIADLERRVRYAIQTYTGQSFGRFRARMNVTGTGESRLPMPQPLLAVYSSNFALENYYLYNEGWYMGLKPYSVGGIKAAPSEEELDMYVSTGVIRAPSMHHRRTFASGVIYSIDGLWGYHDIPGDVQQAARMLVADYACDESLWRDRYIDSVRAGNWRFEMNAGAFAGTGNVYVDQILGNYRRIALAAV